MSRMRNVIGGHLLSSIIGVGVYQLFGFTWWSVSLGVTLALMVMLLTDTLHPPAGGTAFSAIMYRQQYVFIFMPVLLGAFLLVCLSLVFRFISQIDLKHRCRKNKRAFEKVDA